MILGHRPTFQISEEILIGSHSPPSGRQFQSLIHIICTVRVSGIINLGLWSQHRHVAICCVISLNRNSTCDLSRLILNVSIRKIACTKLLN